MTAQVRKRWLLKQYKQWKCILLERDVAVVGARTERQTDRQTEGRKRFSLANAILYSIRQVYNLTLASCVRFIA